MMLPPVLSSPCDVRGVTVTFLWRSCLLILLIRYSSFVSANSKTNGMSVGSFQGMSGVLAVACTGETLDFDVDILTMTLFVHGSNAVLAFVNVNKEKCTTADHFSSCHIDPASSRKLKVETLVLDMDEGESRRYGCNMTILRGSRSYTENVAWALVATRSELCGRLGGGYGGGKGLE